MKISLYVSLLGIAWLPACEGSLDSELDWTGTYQVSSTWDLSPVVEGRTLGTMATEVMVASLIEALDLPGPAQTEAREKLTELVEPRLKPAVDAAVPAEIGPDSPLIQELSGILTAVSVSSTLTLEKGTGILPSSASGLEIVNAYVFQLQGPETFTLNPTDVLPPGAPLPQIDAAWDGLGELTSNNLDVEDHTFDVHVGDLLVAIVQDALEETGVDAYVEQAVSAIDCPARVADIVGGEELLLFSFGGEDYTLGDAQFEAACDLMKTELSERALGLVTPSAGVELGGLLQMYDDDGDGLVDRMESLPSYRGLVKMSVVALPFEATLTATRLVR